MEERTRLLHVGVILAREEIDNPWADARWRPIEIVIGKVAQVPGDVVARGNGFVHYFAGMFEIELHRKETEAYIVNLENECPSVYVVASDSEDDDAVLPIEVRLVTLSPFEAQDFLDTGEDIVEALPMSAAVSTWLEEFVARHHVEEKFVKRRRDRLDVSAERFGQEPIEVTRRRGRKFDA